MTNRPIINSDKLTGGGPGVEEEMERAKRGLLTADDQADILERWHRAIMDNIIAINTMTGEMGKATRKLTEFLEALEGREEDGQE